MGVAKAQWESCQGRKVQYVFLVMKLDKGHISPCGVKWLFWAGSGLAAFGRKKRKPVVRYWAGRSSGYDPMADTGNTKGWCDPLMQERVTSVLSLITLLM